MLERKWQLFPDPVTYTGLVQFQGQFTVHFQRGSQQYFTMLFLITDQFLIFILSRAETNMNFRVNSLNGKANEYPNSFNQPFYYKMHAC